MLVTKDELLATNALKALFLKRGDSMKLSLLLPTLGERRDELRRLLDSLNIQEYKEFQVVIVSQDNHDIIREIISYYNQLEIIHVPIDQKGLSHSRNIGLKHCNGSIVLLSDDDCWYHKDSLKSIADEFIEDSNLDVLLTQIYDKENGKLYKSNYGHESKMITKDKEFLSKSSIEIAFHKDSCPIGFDEDFGLGGIYNSGEEVDFLINNFSKEKNFKYLPKVTVYHPRKAVVVDEKRVINRGALYAKNFALGRAIMDLVKDLVVRKQNYFRLFFKGYKKYKAGGQVVRW
ncbi:glycosyl transferase family 2 [Alkalibaculum bacchi]|uniref:Glycosyl transferase family 2 n=2 Tax=Alkalibaculum bacchi TaxID=645887 RepID=A0A366HXT8_9FIRM|nr:glycosyl transferase family 2 [Alkalibaculum bacchi]